MTPPMSGGKDTIMIQDLNNMRYSELRALALSMARSPAERKQVFDVAKLTWSMPAPKTASSIEAAECKAFRELISKWRIDLTRR